MSAAIFKITCLIVRFPLNHSQRYQLILLVSRLTYLRTLSRQNLINNKRLGPAVVFD